jgi:hypothetical protein
MSRTCGMAASVPSTAMAGSAMAALLATLAFCGRRGA